MTPARILIAGIGNIFLGDDAFGVEVVQRLTRRAWPEGVLVKDFGIHALDLTYALMDGPGIVILVDAAPRGGAPGTLYVIEPDVEAAAATDGTLVDAHAMNPLAVLRMAKSLAGELPKCLLVGCEPAELGDPDIGLMGLSEPVSAAIARAAEIIESLVSKILAADAQGQGADRVDLADISVACDLPEHSSS